MNPRWKSVIIRKKQAGQEAPAETDIAHETDLYRHSGPCGRRKNNLIRGPAVPAGAIRRLGRVDHQDAFLDTDAMERQRGITIFSKQAVLELGETRVTLLDTPGHVDFSAEMERTLQVLDCAVLVISGTDGVQGHTRTLWDLLERYQVPTFLFINKMDLAGADRAALLAHLKDKLGRPLA